MASNLRMAGHHILVGHAVDSMGSDLTIDGSVALAYQLVTSKHTTLGGNSYVMVDTGAVAGNVNIM